MAAAALYSHRLIAAVAGLAITAASAHAAIGPDLDPTSTFGDYLAGRFAAQVHDLGFAADQLDRVVHTDADIPVLNNEAFLAALLAGRPYAVDLALRLPGNPLAQLVLADRAVTDGNWTQAAAKISALPEQDALLQVLRPVLLAWTYAGGGNTDQAMALLAPLTANSRFAGVFALHAALIAELASRQAAAEHYYQIASDRFGASNLRFATILASWQARQGHQVEADSTIDNLDVNGDIALVTPGLKANIAKPAVTSAADGFAEAYLAVAATVREQNVELAEALARLSVQMRPDLTPARLLLADIMASTDRPAEALTQLAGIPATDPLAPLVDLRRAAYLDRSGQPEQAIALLERLAQAYPNRSEPLAQLGDVLRQEKHFADAATAYSEAISRLGTPNRADWPLFYARGISFERAGKWPAAEDDFKYALRLSPDQPSVLNYLAYSWADRDEHLADAKTMIEKAVAVQPNEGAYIDSLGWVLFRQGDISAAIVQLQRAAELDSEDPVVNFHLGDALAAAERMREAEYQWRRALTLQPDPDDAQKLKERLAALDKPQITAPGASLPAP